MPLKITTPFRWPAPLSRKPFNLLLWAIVRLNHQLTGVPIKALCHVTPDLFVGGKISRAGWERLTSWGVGTLINLRVERDDLKLGIRPHTYVWLPTIDGTPPTLEQLDIGVRAIAQSISEGRKVYVHCAAGVGRAPILAAAYLVTQGYSPEEALRIVRRGRPIAGPGRWQQARLREFAHRWQTAAEAVSAPA